MRGGYWFVSFNRVTFAIANENNKVIDTVSLWKFSDRDDDDDDEDELSLWYGWPTKGV